MTTTFFLQLAGLLSLFTFVISLVAVPWIINRMPDDYFLRHWERLEAKREAHPLVAGVTFVVRNLLGSALVTAGIVMLFLPGQGILTIVIGVCVMDFPGKQRLLKRVIQRKGIQSALNWLRKKGRKPLFRFP